MEENKEMEIDLKVLLGSLKKHIAIIILVSIVFGAGGFLGTKYFIDPQYKASARAVIDAGASTASSTGNTNTGAVSPGSILTSQEFVNLFSIMLKSTSVLDPVVEDLNAQGYDVTYEILYSMVSVTAINDTQAVEVSVVSTNKKLALEVVTKVFAQAPVIIEKALPAGNFTAIDSPRYSNNGLAISPSTSKNAVISLLIGFVLICGVFVVKELFNDTMKNEKDLESLGFNIIGKIPNGGKTKSNYGGKYNYKYSKGGK